MKTVITGIVVQVEVTQYNDEGKVAGRPDRPPTFQVLEAAIPDSVLQWIQTQIKTGA
jgi:hypothetical protein